MRKRVLIPVAILAVIALAVFIFLPTLHQPSHKNGRLKSISNLKMISQAVFLYAHTNNKICPPTLGDAFKEGLPAMTFISPHNPNPPERPTSDIDQAAWVDANSDYVLLILGEPFTSDAAKVAGFEKIFSNAGTLVLLGDGSVEYYTMDKLENLAAEQGFELRYGSGFQPTKQ